METLDSGVYLEQGREDLRFIVAWSKLPALSETFADKMASLAPLGISSFRSIEMDFLSLNPQAAEEDKSLADFIGLKASELEAAMDKKLSKIFHTHPKDLSSDFRAFLNEVYYYFVTIKDEKSEELQGFITFMSGGSFPKDEYKITVLAVEKKFRKRGVATFLINFLNKLEIRHKKILVCTRPTNSVAINAYKKWGFSEDRETQENAPSYFVKGHWIHLARVNNR